MSFLSFLLGEKKKTASVAKERLQIILAHERSGRGGSRADYLPQMVLQMACTGAQAVDFVSYCSAMPDKARLCIVRFERDDKAIEEMEDKVRAFLADVDAAVKQVLSYSHKESA